MNPIYDTALGGVFALITKALPSDELQLERFKLRFPKKYQRIRELQLNDAVRYVKLHKVDPDKFADFINGGATMSELIKEELPQPITTADKVKEAFAKLK